MLIFIGPFNYDETNGNLTFSFGCFGRGKEHEKGLAVLLSVWSLERALKLLPFVRMSPFPDLLGSLF